MLSTEVKKSTLDQNIRVKLSTTSTRTSPALDMDIHSVDSAERSQAENFIKAGFKKSYGAIISVSMPQILTVENGKLKAALGIRSAKSPLFIEQYLSVPVEQLNILASEKIRRNEIVEFGSLYSNANRFTIPLFLVTAVSLYCRNYKYLVFSGTEQVLTILKKAGVNFSYVCDADQNLLAASDDDWGSYYQADPKVVLVSLSKVMRVIDKQPRYKKLFETLEQKLAFVYNKMESVNDI